MPFISVITACHNAEPYVCAAINSVLAQSFENFELIFVDDCSTDKSLEAATLLSKKDDRIRIFKTDRKSGAGAARNIAIEYATGDWLAILDADDIWLPNKLQMQVELIQTNNADLVLAGTGCYHIDKSGLRIGRYVYPTHSHALKRNLYSRKKFPPHSSMIYRTSAVRKIGGFNQRFPRSEDYDLWLRLSEVGKYVSCALPLIEYRLHSTNISFQRSRYGFTQIEYGTAARVCQMLRNAGLIDPSTGDDPDLWKTFMEHIARVIHESGYQDYLVWKTEWKLSMQHTDNNFLKLLCSINTITTSPSLFLTFLMEQMRGVGLARKCFRSWIELN